MLTDSIMAGFIESESFELSIGHCRLRSLITLTLDCFSSITSSIRTLLSFAVRGVQNSISSSLVTPVKAGVHYGDRAQLMACGFPRARE